jgi:hypothetical protein
MIIGRPIAKQIYKGLKPDTFYPVLFTTGVNMKSTDANDYQILDYHPSLTNPKNLEQWILIKLGTALRIQKIFRFFAATDAKQAAWKVTKHLAAIDLIIFNIVMGTA